MRWVLGEQSTKTLRGGKMEDVIFKGTGSRGPVGFAQVSLIISNEDGALACDQSEVMVTRRYYRSGESEYFINKAETAIATIDDEGTLTITGTGVVGEGIDKVHYANGYQKDVGKNNISEDNDVIIMQSKYYNKSRLKINDIIMELHKIKNTLN